jgi:iron complex outermembrane receptor protein
MKKFHTNSLKALTFSASAIAFSVAMPAYAQADAEPGEECVTDTNVAGVIGADGDCIPTEEGPTGVTTREDTDITTDASGETGGDRITVTGSRIVRDTYSSISPLQVISGETQRNIGAFDPSQILQRDEAATGQQIDATFQGFVLDNGPGNQTVNLRGLGANRTLLLINGRRLSPAGVEGAPSAPSINLLPSSLIDRVDLLLDGASSIYGSDAVAGVVNVVLRKDFDGLELFGSGNINEMGGGNDFTVSGNYGFNTDRGFIGIGVEYDYRDEIRFRDRDFLAGCDTHYEIGTDGQIRTVGLLDSVDATLNSNGTISQAPEACKRQGYGLGRSIITDFGNFGVLYRPLEGSPFPNGQSGVPGYVESNFQNGAPVDANGDGIQDVRFADYSTNGAFPDGVFIPKQERINALAYGEYTFPGEANITPYFEFLYSRADVTAVNTGISQIVVSVPDVNQFNPCNPAAPGGVDCFDAGRVFNGIPPAGFNIPMNVSPRVSVPGDRDNFDTSIEQYRGVLGVRGDLPFIGSTWRFDVSGTYTRSIGKSTRFGVREDRLALAIGVDPTLDFNGDGSIDFNNDGIADDYDPGENFAANPIVAGSFGYRPPITPCDVSQLQNPEFAAPDLAQGCVPVNLFAPSLIDAFRGEFATQAERDYLIDRRQFDTVYEQTVLSGFLTGDLFELPAGPVGAVVGFEWREDSIDSRPDQNAANGLILNFFSDAGAVGSKWIREAFVEVDLPLVAGETLVEELSVNLSGRFTDEEFYGSAGTFSLKGGWRPVAPLLLRMSYGTSFRAPNLRENFLLGQSGFLGFSDPCAVPVAAGESGTYDDSLENRDPVIIQNCQREGRDPFSVGIDNSNPNFPRVINVTTAQIFTQGSLDLDPETARSITAGFAYEDSFAGDWDVALSGTYYDIKVKDSVVRPGLQFAVNDCYARDDGVRSQFCDQLIVGGAPGDFGLISDARLAFLNLNEDLVRGLDLNANVRKQVLIGGESFRFGVDLRANHLIERSNAFEDFAGRRTETEFAGEFFFPSWTGRATFTAEWEDLLFTWQVRWVGEQEQDTNGIDEFADVFGVGPDGQDTASNVVGDTCTGFGSAGPDGSGPGLVPGDGVFCRDVGFADDYFVHTIALRYEQPTWEARLGITNLFDTAPPLVDPDEVLSISNVPIGGGFDLDGREFFGTILFRF